MMFSGLGKYFLMNGKNVLDISLVTAFIWFGLPPFALSFDSRHVVVFLNINHPAFVGTNDHRNIFVAAFEAGFVYEKLRNFT